KFVGWLAALVFRALSLTLRFRAICEADGTDPSVTTRQGFIYALWHDSILVPLAKKSLSRAKVAALVSRHQDGAYLAEFMHYCRIRSVRGSTARGGDQALRELMQVEDDWNIFITPDGPRGPHHEIKSGPVYLASRTGRPIVPAVSYSENAWHVRGSWTGLVVPKPFSRCWYLLGEPLSIPANLSREQIEFHTLRVQAEMDRLEQKLARIVLGDEPCETARRAA
ncbi:MAG TPA: lysophospholipid acyltransferase family protein, partial [Planctomycetaceae bacterium]